MIKPTKNNKQAIKAISIFLVALMLSNDAAVALSPSSRVAPIARVVKNNDRSHTVSTDQEALADIAGEIERWSVDLNVGSEQVKLYSDASFLYIAGLIGQYLRLGISKDTLVGDITRQIDISRRAFNQTAGFDPGLNTDIKDALLFGSKLDEIFLEGNSYKLPIYRNGYLKFYYRFYTDIREDNDPDWIIPLGTGEGENVYVKVELIDGSSGLKQRYQAKETPYHDETDSGNVALKTGDSHAVSSQTGSISRNVKLPLPEAAINGTLERDSISEEIKIVAERFSDREMTDNPGLKLLAETLNMPAQVLIEKIRLARDDITNGEGKELRLFNLISRSRDEYVFGFSDEIRIVYARELMRDLPFMIRAEYIMHEALCFRLGQLMGEDEAHLTARRVQKIFFHENYPEKIKRTASDQHPELTGRFTLTLNHYREFYRRSLGGFLALFFVSATIAGAAARAYDIPVLNDALIDLPFPAFFALCLLRYASRPLIMAVSVTLFCFALEIGVPLLYSTPYYPAILEGLGGYGFSWYDMAAYVLGGGIVYGILKYLSGYPTFFMRVKEKFLSVLRPSVNFYSQANGEKQRQQDALIEDHADRDKEIDPEKSGSGGESASGKLFKSPFYAIVLSFVANSDSVKGENTAMRAWTLPVFILAVSFNLLYFPFHITPLNLWIGFALYTIPIIFGFTRRVVARSEGTAFEKGKVFFPSGGNGEDDPHQGEQQTPIFERFRRYIREHGESISVVVPVADSVSALSGIEMMVKEFSGKVKVILVGEDARIRGFIESEGLTALDALENKQIINEPDVLKAIDLALSFARQGKANLVFKGNTSSEVLMPMVLDRRSGLRSEAGDTTHMRMFELPGGGMFLMTDGGINVLSGMDDELKRRSRKVSIIRNAVSVMKQSGIERPVISLIAGDNELGRWETEDIEYIKDVFSEEKETSGFDLEGPVSLASVLASGNMSGRVLVFPWIAPANIVYKAYAKGENIVGHVLDKEVPGAGRFSVFKVMKGGKETFKIVAVPVKGAGFDAKKKLVDNANILARELGIDMPKTAILDFTEKVNEKFEKIPSIADALKLVGHYSADTTCLVEGPMAYDIAVSRDAANAKNYHSEVSGRADIMLAPDYDSGCILEDLYKYRLSSGEEPQEAADLSYGGLESEDGTPVFVVVHSRSDTPEHNSNSLTVGSFLAARSSGRGARVEYAPDHGAIRRGVSPEDIAAAYIPDDMSNDSSGLLDRLKALFPGDYELMAAMCAEIISKDESLVKYFYKLAKNFSMPLSKKRASYLASLLRVEKDEWKNEYIVIYREPGEEEFTFKKIYEIEDEFFKWFIDKEIHLEYMPLAYELFLKKKKEIYRTHREHENKKVSIKSGKKHGEELFAELLENLGSRFIPSKTFYKGDATGLSGMREIDISGEEDLLEVLEGYGIDIRDIEIRIADEKDQKGLYIFTRDIGFIRGASEVFETELGSMVTLGYMQIRTDTPDPLILGIQPRCVFNRSVDIKLRNYSDGAMKGLVMAAEKFLDHIIPTDKENKRLLAVTPSWHLAENRKLAENTARKYYFDLLRSLGYGLVELDEPVVFDNFWKVNFAMEKKRRSAPEGSEPDVMRVIISKIFFNLFHAEDARSGASSLSYSKKTWDYVVKRFHSDLMVSEEDTKASYALAKRRLGGLVADFVFFMSEGAYSEWETGIVMRKMEPLDDRVENLMHSGDIGSISKLLEKMDDNIRKTLLRGVFNPDVEFSSYGVDGEKVGMIDAGMLLSLEERISRGWIETYKRSVRNNIKFLDRMDESRALSRYYENLMSEHGLDPGNIEKTLESLVESGNFSFYPVSDITSEVKAFLSQFPGSALYGEVPPSKRSQYEAYEYFQNGRGSGAGREGSYHGAIRRNISPEEIEAAIDGVLDRRTIEDELFVIRYAVRERALDELNGIGVLDNIALEMEVNASDIIESIRAARNDLVSGDKELRLFPAIVRSKDEYALGYATGEYLAFSREIIEAFPEKLKAEYLFHESLCYHLSRIDPDKAHQAARRIQQYLFPFETMIMPRAGDGDTHPQLTGDLTLYLREFIESMSYERFKKRLRSAWINSWLHIKALGREVQGHPESVIDFITEGIKVMPGDGPLVMADLGCGPEMRVIRRVKDSVPRAVFNHAVDILPEDMLADDIPTYIAYHGDGIDNTRIPSGDLDACVAAYSFEHSPDKDLAAGEIRRILREGGKALLVVHSPNSPAFKENSEASILKRVIRRICLNILELSENSTPDMGSLNEGVDSLAPYMDQIGVGNIVSLYKNFILRMPGEDVEMLRRKAETGIKTFIAVLEDEIMALDVLRRNVASLKDKDGISDFFSRYGFDVDVMDIHDDAGREIAYGITLVKQAFSEKPHRVPENPPREGLLGDIVTLSIESAIAPFDVLTLMGTEYLPVVQSKVSHMGVVVGYLYDLLEEAYSESSPDDEVFHELLSAAEVCLKLNGKVESIIDTWEREGYVSIKYGEDDNSLLIADSIGWFELGLPNNFYLKAFDDLFSKTVRFIGERQRSSISVTENLATLAEEMDNTLTEIGYITFLRRKISMSGKGADGKISKGTIDTLEIFARHLYRKQTGRNLRSYNGSINELIDSCYDLEEAKAKIALMITDEFPALENDERLALTVELLSALMMRNDLVETREDIDGLGAIVTQVLDMEKDGSYRRRLEALWTEIREYMEGELYAEFEDEEEDIVQLEQVPEDTEGENTEWPDEWYDDPEQEGIRRNVSPEEILSAEMDMYETGESGDFARELWNKTYNDRNDTEGVEYPGNPSFDISASVVFSSEGYSFRCLRHASAGDGKSQYVFGILKDGNIVGHGVAMRLPGQKNILFRFSIHKAFRERGHGRAVIPLILGMLANRKNGIFGESGAEVIELMGGEFSSEDHRIDYELLRGLLKEAGFKERDDRRLRFDVKRPEEASKLIESRSPDPASEEKHAVSFKDELAILNGKDETSVSFIAVSNSWIKGYSRGERQHTALNPLMGAIRNFCRYNRIEFIEGDDAKVAGDVKKIKNKDRNSRGVVLGGEEIVTLVEAYLRELGIEKDENILLAEVDNGELDENSYIRIMEMLSLTLSLLRYRTMAPGYIRENENLISSKHPDLGFSVSSNGWSIMFKPVKPENVEDLMLIYAIQSSA